MNEPSSSPSSEDLRTHALQQEQQRPPLSTRLVPSTFTNAASEGTVTAGDGYYDDASWFGLSESAAISPIHQESSDGRVHKASASTTSISPIVESNRTVRRRGSSRSSSFASTSDREPTFLQDRAAHLTPQRASTSVTAGANTAAFQNGSMQAHRRDVSADITGRGMPAHSREASATSPVVAYSHVTRSLAEGALRPRPPSTSAWSNFSLAEEYGLGDSSTIDLNKDVGDQYQDADEDSDTRHLTSSRASQAVFHSSQPRTFPEVDLESKPEGLSSSQGMPRRGISKRAKGTEGYYRQSQGARSGSAGLARRKTLLASVQDHVRRMSVRVVNLAQTENDGHVPLDDGADEAACMPAEDGVPQDRPHPPGDSDKIARGGRSTRNEPLRGKSLGIFGPDSLIRKAALSIFLWRGTEPLLLALIVANVVVLTIQSARDVYKHPRPEDAGYFHEWEDWVLFVLFVIFTLEIMARIVVAGFIFNAEESRHTRSYKERIARFRARIDNKPVHAPVMQRSDSSSQSRSDKKESRTFDYMTEPSKSHYDDGDVLTHSQSITTIIPVELNVSSPEAAKYPPAEYAPSMVYLDSSDSSKSGIKAKFASVRSRTLKYHEDVPFVQALQTQRAQHLKSPGRKAFLRHSWNRIDFLAVVAFWIMFLLASTGMEHRHALYVFRALAALRSARLLVITSGTATILRSLKQSAPLMVSVAFFVVFAMALFSIVGVYSFKGSFMRSCVWIDPAGDQNYTLSDQRCGGHINASTGTVSAYIPEGWDTPALLGAKGFICPMGQLCMDISNPYNGTQSFDNVFASLLQVVVVTGANGWADLMYAMIDAEYFASCFFFLICLVLLNFWLMNIFVAVIIHTFGNIREETKHSAFVGRSHAQVLDDEADKVEKESRHFSTSWKRRIAFVTRWAWTAAIVADIGIQASKTADDSPERIKWLNQAELYFTLAFLVEIIARAMSYLPNYRKFARRARNNADTFLAIITTIIQIPGIRNSPVYPWLTVFQLMRFYRVILAVPRMRALLAKVLSSVTGLVNMVLFLLMMNFVVAVVAIQLLRGQIPEEVDGDYVQYSFSQIYNSFLAIYIIFSSENWADILYNATSAEALNGQAWLAAIFIAGWFLFANFILLQMFIAVINEGFAVAEEDKQKAQMQAFIKHSEPQSTTAEWIKRLNPYHYVKARPRAVTADNMRPALALPLGLVNQDHLAASSGYAYNKKSHHTHQNSGTFISSLKRAAIREDQNAFADRRYRFHPAAADLEDENMTWSVDRRLELLKFKDRQKVSEPPDSELAGRVAQVEFISAHPTYDRSLWVFSQTNPLRRLCQRLVEPAHGERIYGVQPHRLWTAAFKLLVLCAIVGSVTIAATATPAYRRDYYLEHGRLRITWFNLTEVSLGFIFVIEFIIKVIADGFIFTPNAYLFSVWNMLDFFVLLTLVINVGTALSPSNAATSRFTRSLKAFRALRLVNLSETMRQTFYNVMIIGASLIFDASVLTVLYIIPFSVWGQNLFSGLLYSCNDGDVLGKTQCVEEFMASPAQWEILVPRAWQNPYVWSFDSFRNAILILFEIVSLEGWSDVMSSAMSISGRDTQAEPNSSQYNSIFFLIYNLIGAIVVLTLFVSVIIENFSRRSGQALLTSEQQQWVDLKKLILRQRPARRPDVRPSKPLQSWCYRRAVEKHGWWSRMITGLYVIHIGVLASQTATQDARADNSRDYVFLALTLVYLLDIGISMYGLGVKSFWQNGWNVYDVFAVTGTLATTIPLILRQSSQVATQLQKLFLVSICFKLVQRNNSLNQLFKTAIASLPAILNVFGLWLTLFLVWAIMFLETFSLTRWEQGETWMQNYSTFPRAMVMLAFMSVGEGWNAFMHDYTVEFPYCSPSRSYLFTDCGDAVGAFVLFITWNVISMYIFANMLTGVVVENFSFVFSLYGKTTSLGREDMRNFKKVWSKYDSKRTGYIKRKDFIPFFSRLTGPFEVSIYPQEYRISPLRAACTSSEELKDSLIKKVPGGLDLQKLNRLLNELDYQRVSVRKKELNRLYQEALLNEEAGKGISFTNMLLMLAQYKLIEPEKGLNIEDLMTRRAQQQRINDLVALDRFRSRLQTIYWRNQFLAYRHHPGPAESTVPEIVLDDTIGDSLPGLQVRPSLLVNTSDQPPSPTRSAGSFVTTPPPWGFLSPRTSMSHERAGDNP